VAVDAGANETHAAGLAVDLVMGDLDSIAPAVHDQYRAQDTPFLIVDPHKDETDLELALAELAHRGFTAVAATNVLGGRLDHELAALGALAQAHGLRSLVIEDSTALVFLLAEKPATSRLRLAHIRNQGDPVSIVPLGGPATVTTTGMEWNLYAESLRPLDPRGISNLVRSHEAAIEVKAGGIIVILPDVLC
jgi:thiamine pyrophosphokinase